MIGLGSRPGKAMKCALPDMWPLLPTPPQDYWEAYSPAAGCLALGRYCPLDWGVMRKVEPDSMALLKLLIIMS